MSVLTRIKFVPDLNRPLKRSSVYEHTKGWQLNLLHRKALLVLIFDNYLLVHVFFAWVHVSHSLSHHKQINFVEELMIADLFQRD